MLRAFRPWNTHTQHANDDDWIHTIVMIRRDCHSALIMILLLDAALKFVNVLQCTTVPVFLADRKLVSIKQCFDPPTCDSKEVFSRRGLHEDVYWLFSYTAMNRWKNQFYSLAESNPHSSSPLDPVSMKDSTHLPELLGSSTQLPFANQNSHLENVAVHKIVRDGIQASNRASCAWPGQQQTVVRLLSTDSTLIASVFVTRVPASKFAEIFFYWLYTW